ncbi:MAG TPA: S8 family peptidase [Actinomycetota bacterium]|nr:S8 family peptidase [Actinomycetota bacterium]
MHTTTMSPPTASVAPGVLVSLALLWLVAASAAGPGGTTADPVRAVEVVVQGSSSAAAGRAVTSTGGTVGRALPIVDGVSARVPAARLDELRADPRVHAVTANGRVAFDGAPARDTSHRIQNIVRADELWARGIDGRGVTVALLDTGVYAEHPDLAGRVLHCEDLSHEAETEAHCADTFGHGTFMAGLIAGDGTASHGKHRGAAPAARIVSVKAAGYDGATDVSTVLAGIQWIVAHRDVYGIRVMNLSLGTDSAQDYRLSPLNHAVERAWASGIAVVVSAGNSGPDAATVMKPGDDPYVITVGASNDEGSMSIGDDRVPVFSSRGPTRANGLAKPDVVSPGVHTVSLRSPGSAIDDRYGATAAVDGHYFKGTGTSMATATVSGIVAQLLQDEPALTPDQVKARLTSTARRIAEADPMRAGAGLVDAYAAATSTSMAAANQGLAQSTGLGFLEDDRGSAGVEVVTPLGQVFLRGEVVAQTDPDEVSVTNPAGLVPWAGATWKADGWDAESWAGATWKSGDWAGATWKGATWKATVWDGATWKGATWKNADWEGATWKGAEWDGATWKASSWQTRMYAAAWD